MCIRDRSLWGEIEDCTVKCKYNEPANDEIKIVFVPVSYTHLAAVAAVLIGKKKIVKEPLMQDIYDGSDDYEEPETDGEYGEDV